MSFDLESDLEDAGIDAFDFSLMDEDERREALEDAGLDTDSYLDADLDSDFDAWSDLQSSGMSIQELKWMDDDERREALVNSGLDPDNYNGLLYDEGSHYSTHRATDEPTSSTAGTYVKSCESNDKPTNTEADFSAPPRETPHGWNLQCATGRIIRTRRIPNRTIERMYTAAITRHFLPM